MTNQSIGSWGEDTACRYLERKGYAIIERNFRRKWGEIDIVASVPRRTIESEQKLDVPRGTSKLGVLRGTLEWLGRFFGTRSKTNQIRVDNLRKNSRDKTIVFVEVKTLHAGPLRPEDNITPAKMRKVIRSCQLYLAAKNYNPNETDWQIDTIGIVVDKQAGKAKIEHLEQAIYL